MNSNLVYFLLAMGIAFFLAIFLYVYPKRKIRKESVLPVILRFLSVVAILMLLINPKWEKHELSIEKPQLFVAVDNSASIDFVNGEEQVRNVLRKIKENKELQEKFNIQFFSFGNNIQTIDSLSFSEPQTNPTELFYQLEELTNGIKTPIILITDGNQTKGNSYEYYNSKNPIYPVVVGDTTQYIDLAITQLNSNQYTFLDNKFPVEIFTLYKGSKSIETQLTIFNNKQKLDSRKLNFTPYKTSQNVSITLPAKEVGVHYYHAVIKSLKNEKNTQNNRKDFSIEVVDQQLSILVLSSFNHPDLGAIKKSIESNKQRKVSIQIGHEKSIDIAKFQLVILYQPTADLSDLIKTIDLKKINKLIISGTKTDWTFLNNSQKAFFKKTTKVEESYLANYNTSFNEYVSKDIGFDRLPPLKDIFGAISFNVPYQSLLFQKIGNTKTESPLLATYIEKDQKNAVLFGEGLWKWRMISKIENKNNKVFDDFFGNLIQYVAKTKEKQQLQLTYKKICYSNQQQIIKAGIVDKNFTVDKKASIWLYLTDKQSKETKKMPFYLKGNQYQIVFDDLKPGNYSFKAIVENQGIKHHGSFKVLDYNVEQQFISADVNRLKSLAYKSGGDMMYADQIESKLPDFVKNKTYKSIQKSKKKSKPLIDWHWLLAFIILSLSVEWFIRKYKGLI